MGNVGRCVANVESRYEPRMSLSKLEVMEENNHNLLTVVSSLDSRRVVGVGNNKKGRRETLFNDMSPNQLPQCPFQCIEGFQPIIAEGIRLDWTRRESRSKV